MTDRCPFTDPQRLFADLAEVRTAGGLPFEPTFGARLVTRHADVVAALHDPATFSSAPTVPDIPEPFATLLGGRVPTRGTLLGHDEPDHGRLRSAVNGFFVPRRLARFEPWIRERAHQVVDGFVERGEVDLKPEFGLPLALQVISHVTGLDPDRHAWLHRALGFFLGPADPHPGTPQEKASLLLELHDHVLELMSARRTDRREDLISHVWDQRDRGAVDLSDFEMLSLVPGLLLAGHETTSNLICTGVGHLLADPARWGRAGRDDASRAAAVEELLRYESAITGMLRLVTRDVELGGVPLRAGEHVHLAYAAASRDPDVFPDPDELDLERTSTTPHLGFGQGIHACLGAPLARLLLRVELEVLHERLPELALAVPAGQLDRSPVGAGRGTTSLPLRFRPSPARSVMAAPSGGGDPAGTVHHGVVTSRRQLTADVVELELTVPDGFPAWEAGAHVDLELPGGLVRSYSLVGRPEPGVLRVAVLRERAGRGGSAAVHRLAVGDRLGLRGPRNHFRLRPARRHEFVAGGIGVTPLLAMVEAAADAGADWSLLLLGRSTDRLPYAADLLSAHPGRVEVWTSADRGRYDLAALATRVRATGAVVHACGPEALLAGLEEALAAAGVAGSLVVERFATRAAEPGPRRPFEVELARSGRVLPVGADESLLDVVNAAGAGVPSTCREGTCGTCEARVLGGVPDHRDVVLTLDEQLAGDTVMTCVSRCRGPRLVLDL